MRQHIVLLACICSTIAIVSAVPLPASNRELDVLQIPLNNGKELDVLTLGTAEQLAERNKRTVGLLRDLFPDITKQIDDQANRIISKLLRVLGPTVLRTAIQGNTANRARTDFDADFDDDDDDDSSSNSSSASAGTKVSIELPTFSPEDSNEDNETDSDSSSTTTSTTIASDDDNQTADGASIDLEALNKQLEETIRVARQASAAEASDAEQQQLTSTNEVQTSSSSIDQQTAESKTPIDDLSLDSNEEVDLDDRNKRFLAFGGNVANGGDAGATGNKGNSGNFLFDIVRLFSGSVQTQTGDEAANAPSSSTDDSTDSNDTDGSRTADGYTEGIPGPVTRLVVLANRGLANLIQDLILRIAATSERLVNFKARLITALI